MRTFFGLKTTWIACGLLMALSFSALGLITGCGSQPPAKPKPITLQFWTLQLRDFTPWMQRLLSAFEAQHPNVRVHWVDLPFSEGEKRTLAAMLSPTVPDLVNLNPAFSMLLAQRGTLTPLDAHLAATDKAAFLPPALQACQLDGRTVALPWYLSTRLVFYNKTLLQRMGWKTLPLAPHQWQAAAKALWVKEKARLFFADVATGGNFLKALQNQGVGVEGLFEETASFSRFTPTPAAESLMRQYRALYYHGFLAPEVLTGNFQQALAAYQNGKLLWLEAGASLLRPLKENAPALYAQTAVQARPTNALGWVDVNPMVLVLPQRGQHKALAMALAKHITSSPWQLSLAQQAPVLPSTLAALNNPLFCKNTATLEGQALCLSSRSLLKAKQGPVWHPNQKERNDTLNAWVQGQLLEPVDP